MSKLDQRIAEALEAEDRILMEQLGEQGVIAQFGGLFQGRLAWTSVMAVFLGLVATLIFFYGAWKFISVDDTTSMLRWGGLAWLGLTLQLVVKQWTWMRMETNRTLREVKRLELQMARLLEKI